MPKTGELADKIIGPLKVMPHSFNGYIFLEDTGMDYPRHYFEMSSKDFVKCASLLNNGEFSKDIKWEYKIVGGKKVAIRPSFMVPKRKPPSLSGYIVKLKDVDILWYQNYLKFMKFAPLTKTDRKVEVPKEIKASFKLMGRISSKSNTYLYYKATDCSNKQLEDVCIIFHLDHIMEKFDLSIPKEFKSIVELKKKNWIRGSIKTDQLESWTITEYLPKEK